MFGISTHTVRRWCYAGLSCMTPKKRNRYILDYRLRAWLIKHPWTYHQGISESARKKIVEYLT